jgi:hypothetical protein
MPESISGANSVSGTAGVLSLVSATSTWRSIYETDGTQVPVGVNNWGSFGFGGVSGISLVIAGIDPVIQFALAVRLGSTGQIWPIGFPR